MLPVCLRCLKGHTKARLPIRAEIGLVLRINRCEQVNDNHWKDAGQ